MIWKKINKTDPRFLWGEQFKIAFITQDRGLAQSLLGESFGFHNGKNKQEYIDYEMEEFFIKKEKFSLSLTSQVSVFELDEEYFYYTVGNDVDKNVFEAIFQYNKKTGLFAGNQYPVSIETKTQAILYYKDLDDYLRKNKYIVQENLGADNIFYRKRINLFSTSLMKVEEIKKTVSMHDTENYHMKMNHLEKHLGGDYLSISYENQEKNSLFEHFKIFSKNKIYDRKVLFKNFDHPQFTNFLFPIIEKENDKITVLFNQFLIINILSIKTNKKEIFVKYPSVNKLELILEKDENIEYICLTDTLSLDWIIQLK